MYPQKLISLFKFSINRILPLKIKQETEILHQITAAALIVNIVVSKYQEIICNITSMLFMKTKKL